MGLIPASAGQTINGDVDAGLGGAHPRECGADDERGYVQLSVPGSSPRVRGRRVERGVCHRGDGLIPASAGQTVTPRPLGV